MIALLRHGERADDAEAKYEGPEIFVDYDPPLTQKGKQQAFTSGQLIREKMFSPHCGSDLDSALEGWQGAEISSIEIITSPFLRCLQTARYLSEGMGLKAEKVCLKVEWIMGEYMAPSFFTSWQGEGSPLKGLTLFREKEQVLYEKHLDGFKGKVLWSEKQAWPDYPQHISQCKNRYRRMIQQLIIKQFRGLENSGKLILVVSHAYSAEEFMRLFDPFKCYKQVDYCSLSVAIKRSFKQEDEIEDGPTSPCAGGDGQYGPWELIIANDATHVGLAKPSPVEFG